MSEREVDKARGVVEKATPGPWLAGNEVDGQFFHQYGDFGWYVSGPAGSPELEDSEQGKADATFIATFDPDFVRKLLDLWKVAQTLSDSPPGKRYGFLPLYNALEALEQTGDRS